MANKSLKNKTRVAKKSRRQSRKNKTRRTKTFRKKMLGGGETLVRDKNHYEQLKATFP
jgi:hypothetical protein